MQWQKETIVLDDHTKAQAQAPVIISASRATDIPTFYSDWFISRWKAGYIKWINPFNNQPLYVSFKNVRAVVFWTKNPRPMFKYLDYMDENIPNYYFQFTLNDYDQEHFEAKVPKLESRIETFIELSQRLGKKRVVWRFDPLILTDTIDVTELLRRIKNIGDQLHGYTEKLVISFADIGSYKKVENNLKKEDVPYVEFTSQSMVEIAKGLQELNKEWGLDISTCSEKIDLEEFDITHNRCVDDDLMIDIFSHDKELMDFLGVEIVPADLFSDGQVTKKQTLKDKGQRKECGCIMSKDIGQYNTCPHECNYCYANTSKEIAKKNYQKHKDSPNSEGIISSVMT